MGDIADPSVLLLPERRRFSGQPITAVIAKLLGRADRQPSAESGEQAQLLRYFHLPYFQSTSPGWPMAAITREAEFADAGDCVWLRADPVHVLPDSNGVRLMAWGNLGLSAEEAEQFLAALHPLFAEHGFSLSAKTAERWYLTLPTDMAVPQFAAPTDALGEDLLEHLPDGTDGRRWRVLLNESQIILHNHPSNSQRLSAGLLPINSLWFWGAGTLPKSVQCRADAVISEEYELLALAKLAGVAQQHTESGNVLFDLRQQRLWSSVETIILHKLSHAQRALVLDFSDGARWRIEPGQRWRVWRRPLGTLDA